MGAQTRLVGLEQGGCSRLLFPRLSHRQGITPLEAVMVNISGGIAAGDHLRGRIVLGEGSDLLMTSQAHERVYKARPQDPSSVMEIECHLAAQSRLEWLPHGTIFFNGARLKRKMTVDMAVDGRFLYYESRIFGRRHSDEIMRDLALRDHLSIRRAGTLIFRDSIILESSDCASFLARRGVSHGQGVMATFVLVAPESEAILPALREIEEELPECLLASSAWNGMVVTRVLAERSWDLERLAKRLLPLLREGRSLPSSWSH